MGSKRKYIASGILSSLQVRAGFSSPGKVGHIRRNFGITSGDGSEEIFEYDGNFNDELVGSFVRVKETGMRFEFYNSRGAKVYEIGQYINPRLKEVAEVILQAKREDEIKQVEMTDVDLEKMSEEIRRSGRISGEGLQTRIGPTD
jgi:hypothetical protein